MQAKNKAMAVAAAVSILGGAGAVQWGFGPSGVEGRAAAPYYDTGGVLTDCYGNTKNVKPHFIRSENECLELMGGEASRIADKIAPELPGVSPVTLAAFISFTYNVGDSGALNSTAFKHWKNGQQLRACLELARWIYVKKKADAGLINRRQVEMFYCVSGLNV